MLLSRVNQLFPVNKEDQVAESLILYYINITLPLRLLYVIEYNNTSKKTTNNNNEKGERDNVLTYLNIKS